MIGLDETWKAYGGLQGGLVVAWLLERAQQETSLQPTAVTAHFVRSVGPHDADLTIDAKHLGRSTGSVAVDLMQDGRLRAHALIEFCSGDAEPRWASPLDLARAPVPSSLERYRPDARVVPFTAHLDIRPLTARLPDETADRPEYEAWIALTSPGTAAALGPWGTAAVVLDAMPPALQAITEDAAIPSVELTIHFAPPAAEPATWFHIAHRTVWAETHRCVEETELRTPAIAASHRPAAVLSSNVTVLALAGAALTTRRDVT